MPAWNKLIAFILSIFGIITYIPQSTQEEIPENATTCDAVIMSFNVYVAGTGDKSPESRSEGVIAAIRKEMPDVFGLQEADSGWMERITQGMPEYSYVGRGRDRKETDGEYSPVFYKTDKYDLLSSGTFWFSSTPDKPSLTWAAVFRRICSWAVLRDKETGVTFAVFNSHWDHISIISRNKSAKLLLEKIEEYAPDMPVVITGDFNCDTKTTAYETLVTGGFADSMYVSPTADSIATYHGYTDTDLDAELPIDHIMFKSDMAYSHSYRVITDRYEGIYPSDHFPIVSEITLYTQA